jgi:hypothetical protein
MGVKDMKNHVVDIAKARAKGIAKLGSFFACGIILSQEYFKRHNTKSYHSKIKGVHKNAVGTNGICLADFVVPLVKAVPELSKQNDDLKKQNEELNQDLIKERK